MMSSQDLPDRIDGRHLGISSAEALAGAEQLAQDLREHAPKIEPVAESPKCPRCGSPRWVSVSLNGGYTRRAQCVPCGAYHPDVIGPGWQSPRFADPDAVLPAYRDTP